MKKAYGNLVYTPRLLEIMALKDYSLKLASLANSINENLNEAITDVTCTHFSFVMQKTAMEGKCIHFFFEGDHFRDWLAQCKTPLQDELLECINQFAADLRFKENTVNPVFAFHFEGGNTESYLCSWLNEIENLKTGIVTKQNVLIVYRSPYKPVAFQIIGHEYEKNDTELDTIFQTCASCLAYIQAFPEMVSPGIPNNLKNPNWYRKTQNRTVKVSPVLIDRNGPIPHYRIGHFRFLSSPRFTHKQGKTIFVHGCFVKGQAETVSNIDKEIMVS